MFRFTWCVSSLLYLTHLIDTLIQNYDLQPIAKELGQERNAAEGYGGYSLVWPLYVAANAETIPQEQRDWLSGRLMMIGTRFGLTSAQVLVLARRHVLTCGPMFP